jgi:hypothetical protein
VDNLYPVVGNHGISPEVARATDALLGTRLSINAKLDRPRRPPPARTHPIHRINRPYYESLVEISKREVEIGARTTPFKLQRSYLWRMGSLRNDRRGR